MKKILTVIALCAGIVLSSAACSGGTASQGGDDAEPSAASESSTEIQVSEAEKDSSDTKAQERDGASKVSNEGSRGSSAVEKDSPESKEPKHDDSKASADEGSQGSADEEEIHLSFVSLSESSIELYPGESRKLAMYYFPEDATRTDFKWKWSDNSIISVDRNGNVTGKAVGTATVTIETYNGLTASCEVKVIERNYEQSDDISEMSFSESEDEKDVSEDSKADENSEGESSQEPEYKPAPEITGKRVEADWFDDAIFVGDSISVGLCNYADNGSLGDAEFLAKECMGFHSAMWDLDYVYAIHPTYNGREVRIEDGIQEIGKKKVFILLGMNDICSWGPRESVDAMKDFTDMLLAKNPDITIYIQSATPIIAGKVREDYLNNENIREYNELVKPVCKARGFVYLDIASVLSDENGDLRADYCSDASGAGHHFNRAGFDAWVEYLKNHVG